MKIIVIVALLISTCAQQTFAGTYIPSYSRESENPLNNVSGIAGRLKSVACQRAYRVSAEILETIINPEVEKTCEKHEDNFKQYKKCSDSILKKYATYVSKASLEISPISNGKDFHVVVKEDGEIVFTGTKQATHGDTEDDKITLEFIANKNDSAESDISTAALTNESSKTDFLIAKVKPIGKEEDQIYIFMNGCNLSWKK